MVTTSQGVVDPRLLLNTGLFDMDEAQQAPGWLHELNAFDHQRSHPAAHDHSHPHGHGHGPGEQCEQSDAGDAAGGASTSGHSHGHSDEHSGHAPQQTEAERYGITSFVYYAQVVTLAQRAASLPQRHTHWRLVHGTSFVPAQCPAAPPAARAVPRH